MLTISGNVKRVQPGMILLLLIAFCGCGPKQFVQQQLKYKGLKITWYTESYISSSQAFVSVEKEGRSTIILDCEDSEITNIAVVNGVIIIKVKDPKNFVAYAVRRKVYDVGVFIK